MKLLRRVFTELWGWCGVYVIYLVDCNANPVVALKEKNLYVNTGRDYFRGGGGGGGWFVRSFTRSFSSLTEANMCSTFL